ncbi:putative Actin family [Plasmopara halstedii]
MKVVALDAGGATLKASVVVPGVTPTVSILANHVASTSVNPSTILMGQKLQELERLRSKLRYLRPVQRIFLLESSGYCVNWNIESELWAYLMNEMLQVDPSEYALVVTSPLLSPAIVNESTDEVVFEELGFDSYARVSAAESCVLSYSAHCERKFQSNFVISKTPALLSPCSNRQKLVDPPLQPPLVDDDPLRFSTSSCHLVVDSGFSFTHVIPVINGKVYLPGLIRINVGGKLLTNYLKEIVSYRQWNVMDDTSVINELKEALCYCSLHFKNDLDRYHFDRNMRKHWILPDFVRTFKGRCREDDQDLIDEQYTERQGDTEQTLEMGVERVTVPEILFNPSDIGISQAGIAETIVQAVEACPDELSSALYANILLVGGNTKFGNFRQRLEQDLRPLVPDDFDIEVHESSDPILAAWQGCCSIAESDALSTRIVSKKEYDEHGSNICLKKFQQGLQALSDVSQI